MRAHVGRQQLCRPVAEPARARVRLMINADTIPCPIPRWFNRSRAASMRGAHLTVTTELNGRFSITRRSTPRRSHLDALARLMPGRGDNERAIRFYRESLKAHPKNDWAMRNYRRWVRSIRMPTGPFARGWPGSLSVRKIPFLRCSSLWSNARATSLPRSDGDFTVVPCSSPALHAQLDFWSSPRFSQRESAMRI